MATINLLSDVLSTTKALQRSLQLNCTTCKLSYLQSDLQEAAKQILLSRQRHYQQLCNICMCTIRTLL